MCTSPNSNLTCSLVGSDPLDRRFHSCIDSGVCTSCISSLRPVLVFAPNRTQVPTSIFPNQSNVSMTISCPSVAPHISAGHSGPYLSWNVTIVLIALRACRTAKLARRPSHTGRNGDVANRPGKVRDCGSPFLLHTCFFSGNDYSY